MIIENNRLLASPTKRPPFLQCAQVLIIILLRLSLAITFFSTTTTAHENIFFDKSLKSFVAPILGSLTNDFSEKVAIALRFSNMSSASKLFTFLFDIYLELSLPRIYKLIYNNNVKCDILDNITKMQCVTVFCSEH